MAFAVRAISQGTSCSQPCIPGATKDFLFKPSENSPSCLFTQEHSEPPVAIVVKVFCSHRGPASSKEHQSPHSGIVSPLTHSSHRTHSTDTAQGLSSPDTWAPFPHKGADIAYVAAMELFSPQLTQVTDTFLGYSFYIKPHVCHCVQLARGGGAASSHSNYSGKPRGCSIIIDSTNSSSLCFCQKSLPVPNTHFGTWLNGKSRHEHLCVFYSERGAMCALGSTMGSPRLWERVWEEHGKM